MSLSHLDSLLKPDSMLVVALSGGLDSTVLLHQLLTWQQRHPLARLRALHVHHGLSPNAERWAAHCLAVCQQWKIDCEILRVTVDTREHGIEAAARQVRYQALSQALKPGECLLTAQHLDDQCETLLLALKRGSGPAGLASMPLRLPFGENTLLRPLLNVSRQQLESWAETHQLSWVEDESNQDTRFDRNFLRQHLMPDLLARWPHFAQSVARSAALCGEQEQLLDELLADELAALLQQDGSLHFPPLLKMSDVRRHALLRRWIASQQGEMPSRDALQRICQEVMLSRDDAQPRLQLGNHEVRRYRHQLYWLLCQPSLREQVLNWPDRTVPLELPQNTGTLYATSEVPVLRFPQKDEHVSVRFKAQGHIHIVGRSGGREMKKLWQEWGIPTWQRDQTPLLYYNDELICAPGIFVTQQGAAPGALGWQLIWQK